MLTPMQVQYLVGLCCLKVHPDAVEVILGDRIPDSASETTRDVDITVTSHGPGGVVRAFKGYEVKRESTPLDVADVEQLCLKLRDMPSVTHGAIVSASGFTAAATRKALHHNVELYELQDWNPPSAEGRVAFSLNNMRMKWRFGQTLLRWVQGFYVDYRVSGEVAKFDVTEHTPLFTALGQSHPVYRVAKDFWDEIALRSTECLFLIPPASTILLTMFDDEPMENSAPWSHTHTLDVRDDEVYLHLEDTYYQIVYVSITGELQWQCSSQTPDFSVMKRVPDGEIFAGLAVTAGPRPGEMFALTISPQSQSTGVHPIKLAPAHVNAIRMLALRQQSMSK